MTHLPVKAELARRPDLIDRQVIISSGGSGHRFVLDASFEAQAAGVRAGQKLTEALSNCHDAVTLTVDDQYLEETDGALLDALFGAVDRVQPADCGTFHIDLTGLAPMYGGEDSMASAILSAIDGAWQPRLGLAVGKFPAFCAAASAKLGEWFKAPANAARWLASWPLPWLPLEPDSAARLRGFGVATLGDVAAMSADQLTDFLGGDGRRIWSLARGVDPDPVVPISPQEVFTERLEFPFPVDTVSGWEAGVRVLTERVWNCPGRQGRGITDVRLIGELTTGGSWHFQRTLREPAPSAERLCAATLAALNAQDSRGRGRWPESALVELSLTASGLTPLRGRQTTLWTGTKREDSPPAVQGVESPVALSPQSPLPERRWALGSELRPLGQAQIASVLVHDDFPQTVNEQQVWKVVDLWEVDTDWWTSEPARRRYWQVLLSRGGMRTVYCDLTTGEWRRQGY